MAHDFNASNEPRTCLWCGARLYAVSSEKSLKRDLLNYETLFRSNPDRREHLKQERIAYHERVKGQYGKHANIFCTDKCAIAFAVAAVHNGYRFTPKLKEIA
jgi:hypothetical protein